MWIHLLTLRLIDGATGATGSSDTRLQNPMIASPGRMMNRR